MRFAFTDDQLEITAAAREMLLGTCQPTDLRALLASGAPADPARWASIVEMGLLGIQAPEEAGGLGLGSTDFVGVAEAAGYVALPEPLVEQAGIAIPLLAELGDPQGRLGRAIAGEIVAIGSPYNTLVADADTASAFLLADGGDIHLVARDAVTLERAESVDPFRRMFRVSWTPAPATRIAGDWGRTAERGALATASQMIGLAQRAIDLAVAYAKERTQFGKPIGGYQAVKHLLATAQVKVEFARPVVNAAAAELPLGTQASGARVAHAKIAAAAAADLATQTAVQVHGAMGITWEVDLHFFLTRVIALRGAWGTSSAHRATVIERLRALPTGPTATFASELA